MSDKIPNLSLVHAMVNQLNKNQIRFHVYSVDGFVITKAGRPVVRLVNRTQCLDTSTCTGVTSAFELNDVFRYEMQKRKEDKMASSSSGHFELVLPTGVIIMGLTLRYMFK